MINVKQYRDVTPGCSNVLHFDNAGAALMPDPVFDAMHNHLLIERNIGGQEAARQAKPVLESFYDEFAMLLNAKPSEIAYVENATRAWDMAFYGLPLKAGDRITTHAQNMLQIFWHVCTLPKCDMSNLISYLLTSSTANK
ncbi:MAG: aminotransferase class V-fold PLP-dependent enzyme [Aestuariibacter sp.]